MKGKENKRGKKKKRRGRKKKKRKKDGKEDRKKKDKEYFSLFQSLLASATLSANRELH